MSGISVGPSCRRCRKNEQDCAWSYPCCDGCLHKFGEPAPEPTGPVVALVVVEMRCADPRAGTDTGYYRHLRSTKTMPCAACRKAHSDAERSRAARKRERTA